MLVANHELIYLPTSMKNGPVASPPPSAFRFDHYTADELVAILDKRVTAGHTSAATTRDQWWDITEAAGGDARKALGTLWVAARETDYMRLEELTDGIIEDAISEIRRANLERLNDISAFSMSSSTKQTKSRPVTYTTYTVSGQIIREPSAWSGITSGP